MQIPASVTKILLFITIAIIMSCEAKEDRRELERSEDIKRLSLDATDTTHFQKLNVFGDSDEVMFNFMGTVEVDDQNHVYISESSMGSRTVHHFSPDGDYLGSIGQEGDGPGEFRTLRSIQYHQGSLYLHDYYHSRVLIFRKEQNSYTYKGLINLANLSSEILFEVNRSPWEFYAINDGSFIVGFEEPSIPNQDRKRYYFKLDQRGVLAPDPIFEHQAVNIYHHSHEGVSMTMELPFRGKPLLAVTDDGIIYKSWSEDFSIDLLNTEGNTITTLYYPLTPQPLNRTEHIKEYESNQNFHRAIQQVDFPETWPVLDNIVVDDEKRLWVSTIVEDCDIFEWWIIDESGEVITRFEWPRDEPIAVIRNGFLYPRETDKETGIQQISQYKVTIDSRY